MCIFSEFIAPIMSPAMAPIMSFREYRFICLLKVPTFLISAELDPTQQVAADMFALLCERGDCPRYKQAQGHNHMSMVVHLNTEDDSLGPDLLDFVNRTVSQMAAK